MSAVMTPSSFPRPPVVAGLPLIGSTLSMAKDPAKFFYDSYRKYGPVYRVNVFGHIYTVIAGAEAANFMGTREGKECLRSREAWEPLAKEFGLSKLLGAEDGEMHQKLRNVMKRGFSREALRGRYNLLLDITRHVIDRDWKPGSKIQVVEAMQYMVVDQLGTMLTGSAPHAYVKDIRKTILYILNVLITRQRPAILLKMPEYKRAKARMVELGRQMVADYRARKEPVPEDQRTLIDDIMEAHARDPELVPESDLANLMVAPYVAGLDTVANATSACLYTILRDPAVLKKMQAEVDALYDKGPITDEIEYMKALPYTNGVIMESMRLYPIAVAQIRVANKDFVYHGHQMVEGEMIYLGTSVPHFQNEFYPDAQKFDPERYEKPRCEHQQVGAYSPYGRGAHTCLGKAQAEVILAMTMSKLIYHLDLELPSPDYQLKTKTAPTPGPALSFYVRVKGRRH